MHSSLPTYKQQAPNPSYKQKYSLLTSSQPQLTPCNHPSQYKQASKHSIIIPKGYTVYTPSLARTHSHTLRIHSPRDNPHLRKFVITSTSIDPIGGVGLQALAMEGHWVWNNAKRHPWLHAVICKKGVRNLE